MKIIDEGSIFLSIFKKISDKYQFIEEWLDEIGKDSKSHIICQKMCNKIKAYLRDSLFWGLIQRGEETIIIIFTNSKIIRWELSVYMTARDRIIDYLNTNRIINSIKEAKERLYFTPFRIASIVMVMVTLVNIVLSLVLKKEVSLIGYLILVGFLVIGISGIFYKAGWPELIESSFILRKLNEKNKDF